ncbi:uncharacterized protein [Macrobrachium rosenbergii]|uniref:uncharacterized protein n=1 Tax=Macrobrachium rosenbergii TaxID=79674 RepID=UPI0034D63DFB
MAVDMWTTLVQCRFKGKAQRVYNGLNEELSADYDTVKAIILKAYDLVPEAYRQKFRNFRKTHECTYVEFARKKEQYFDDWLKSREVTEFDKLRELILVEEFKISVSRDLRTHLEELKLDVLQEVAIAADEYVLTHRQEGKFMPSNKLSDCGDSWLRSNPGPPSGKGTYNIKPTGVTTRSRAREVENFDINLDEIGNQPVLEPESMEHLNLDYVDWDSETFRQAQNREFHPDVDVLDFEDITKPFFYRINNLLYRVSRAKEVPADKVEVKRQLLVPERYREKLLSLAHESSLAGHFGVHKCFQKLAELYFWPGMRRDVKRFVLSCRVCQLVGKPNQKIPKAPLIPIPSVGEPFREVIIDVVGPLPRTRGGCEYLLTIVDRMSRYPEAIPLRSVKAEKVVEALVNFFTKFGIPKVLQSDCGTNFTSRIFRKKMSELGVKHITSSPYHPESQGQLVFGHNVRGPLDIVREHLEVNDNNKINVIDYLSNLQEKLRSAWEFAQNNLVASQSRMKFQYDLDTKSRSFEVGDKVLVLLPLPGNMLKAQFSGPWKVVKKLSEVNYVIETPQRRRKTQICHVNMLKPFVDRESAVEPVAVEPVAVVDVPVDLDVVRDKFDSDSLKNPVELSSLSENSTVLDNLQEKLRHLEKAQVKSLVNLINENKILFQDAPGRTSLLQHDVDIGQASPIKQCPYRLNPFKRNIVQSEVNYMLDHDLIKPSSSPWSSPVVLVKKEGDQHRLCFDYRKVNEVTKTDSYPLPRVEDCIDKIGSAKYISKFDLLKGYWQVGLTPRAREVSAFVTGDGLYECQEGEDGILHPVAYFSKKLIAAQRKYSTIEKEALCLVKAVEHFDVYLNPTMYPIDVYTDHNPLVFLNRCKDKNQRILRWSLFLQEYNLNIRHISGKDNVIPDALSRSFLN